MKIDKLIIILFFLFSVLHQMIGEKDDLLFLRLTQIIGMSALLKLLYEINFQDVIKKRSFKIVLICVISAFLVGIANNRLYLLNLIYPLSFFSIAYFIVKVKPSPTIFVIISLFVFASLFYFFLRGISPEEWLKGSRNYVSVVLIYLTTVTICIAYINNKTQEVLINLILPFLCLIFSVIALGRSGIITSFFLFIASIINSLNNIKNNSVIKWFIFFTSIGIIYFVSENFDIIESTYLYKFDTKGLDLAERGYIIDLYIDNIDIISFIFGPLNVDSIYMYEGITLHNSYLHWHYSYGLGAFIIFFLVLKSTFKSFKYSTYFNLLLALILVRSFSDQILLSDGILLGLPLFIILMMNDNYIFKKTIQ